MYCNRFWAGIICHLPLELLLALNIVAANLVLLFWAIWDCGNDCAQRLCLANLLRQYRHWVPSPHPYRDNTNTYCSKQTQTDLHRVHIDHSGDVPVSLGRSRRNYIWPAGICNVTQWLQLNSIRLVVFTIALWPNHRVLKNKTDHQVPQWLFVRYLPKDQAQHRGLHFWLDNHCSIHLC
jgi:hypothetical protein